MKKSSYRYLLGDSKREATRLRAQSRLWDPTTHALFDRLKIKSGWKILEIGPGQGSLHLELRRRAKGAIDAVERSPVFTKKLISLCRRDGFGDPKIWNCDLIDAPIPDGHYDLIFARWVFLFLPHPEAHLRKLVRALRPGGLIAIEDYYRDTLALIPLPKEWPDFMAADHAFFASQKGDANIGARLPALFKKVGLQVIEITPNMKSGHPGTPTWNWLSNYFLEILDRYAGFSPFNKTKAESLRRQWISSKRTTLLIAPTVLDVVGKK